MKLSIICLLVVQIAAISFKLKLTQQEPTCFYEAIQRGQAYQVKAEGNETQYVLFVQSEHRLLMTLNDSLSTRRDYSGYSEELSNIYICLTKSTHRNIEVTVDFKFGAELKKPDFRDAFSQIDQARRTITILRFTADDISSNIQSSHQSTLSKNDMMKEVISLRNVITVVVICIIVGMTVCQTANVKRELKDRKLV